MAETGRKLLRRELFDSRRARPAVRHDAGGIDETVLAAFRFAEPMGATVVSQPDRAGTDTLVGAEERPAPGVGRAIHFLESTLVSWPLFASMEHADHLDELLTCRLGQWKKAVEPCTVVIFGASGDLTARKLIPAFYHLFREKQLPTPFRIIGFARREKTDEAWRQELRAALEQFSRTKPIDDAVWVEFATNVSYCQGDISDPSAYKKLADRLASFSNDKLRRNLLFYLATSPSQFGEVVEHLHQTGLLRKEVASEPDQRVVVEKPFGHDLASAHKLNAELTRFAHEKQIFRIDHYLGKETVQNILMFRFSNSIFEQLWNRQSVDHVQITVSAKLGVGTRGVYD